MTPVEKIIMQGYAENTFIFDPEDEEHYFSGSKLAVLLKIQERIQREQAVQMSVTEIKAKYRYLRDIFVKADNLVQDKQKLTYLQRCVYQRMFYLKPFIKKKGNKSKAGKYEAMMSMKCQETASDALNNQMKDYLKSTKKNTSNDLTNILNERIRIYKDTRTQRLVFCRILKLIKTFQCSLSSQAK